MMGSWRIGLYVGLAISEARPERTPRHQPAAGIADRPRATATPATAATRRSTATSSNRLTSTSRRSTAYTARSTPAAYGPGTYAEDDPLRPYSAQARQSAAAISPTRLSEGPPPPPRMAPPARYDYYANMHSGQHPNANVPQVRRHCTPSRGGVMAGSLGGFRSPVHDRPYGQGASRSVGPAGSLGYGQWGARLILDGGPTPPGGSIRSSRDAIVLAPTGRGAARSGAPRRPATRRRVP